MRSAQSHRHVEHAARAAREGAESSPRVTTRSPHRIANRPRPGRTKSVSQGEALSLVRGHPARGPRCEAARPTDRQRTGQRKGSGPAAAGPRPRKATAECNETEHETLDLSGQLPGAKRLPPARSPRGNEKTTGSPTPRAAKPPQPRREGHSPGEDSPAGAPRSAATQAPGGRATHRTRARSAQVLAQPGAARHEQPGRAAAKRSTERRRTA